MENKELYHYGVKGQKWGVRRYQNADGTLTAEGKKRQNTSIEGNDERFAEESNKLYNDTYGNNKYSSERAHEEYNRRYAELLDKTYPIGDNQKRNEAADYFKKKLADLENSEEYKNAQRDYSQLTDKYLAKTNRESWDGDGSELFESMTEHYKGEDRKTLDKCSKVFDREFELIVKTEALLRKSDYFPDEERIINYKALKEYQELEHSEQDEVTFSSDMSEDSDHLEHYGIKGMKWGIRRFQNKDGSLTKAGLKRYSDAASDVASKVGKAVAEGGKKLGEAASKAATATKEKIAEKHAERKEEKRVEKLMSKPIRKLTEEERIERMDRKMKEKELLNLEKNVRDLDAGAMSKGRKFAEDMVTKVAIPAVLTAGEKQLTAFLNKKFGDALGLGEKDTTVIKDLLSGERNFKDLTDKEFNTVGKAGESAGSFIKNLLGKNPEQNDNGPSTTLVRDVLSGKIKLSDLDDKTGKEVSKNIESLSNAQKVVDKMTPKDKTVSESESKPKTENNSESTTDAKSSKTKVETKSKSESKDDSDMDRILNSNIDDLSNEDLAKADKWLRSIGV